MTKEAVLSLNEREQRILSRVAEELAKTAPALMALVTGFNRLAAGEAMPLRRPLRRRRRRVSRAMASWTFMAVWSFMTFAMIAVALILSHVSHGADAVGHAASFSGPSR